MKFFFKYAGVFVITVFFFVLNWLTDLYENFGSTTNGLWDNFFWLDIVSSYHLVWYLSMLLFLGVVLWLLWEIRMREKRDGC
jgi:hypothetical protein